MRGKQIALWVTRNSQMARCLAYHLLVQVIRPFFKTALENSCIVRFIKIAYCSIAHVRSTEMLHE